MLDEDGPSFMAIRDVAELDGSDILLSLGVVNQSNTSCLVRREQEIKTGV